MTNKLQCPHCSGNELKKLEEDEPFTEYECSSCGKSCVEYAGKIKEGSLIKEGSK